MVVALGDILIVTEADINSGSIRSVEYALKMDKEIFVLPQRLDESLGTNYMLHHMQVKAIHDIEEFVSRYGQITRNELEKDDFFIFVKLHLLLMRVLKSLVTGCMKQNLRVTSRYNLEADRH